MYSKGPQGSRKWTGKRLLLGAVLTALLAAACVAIYVGDVNQPSSVNRGTIFWSVVIGTWTENTFNPSGMALSTLLPTDMSALQWIVRDDAGRDVQTVENTEVNQYMNDSFPPPPGYVWHSFKQTSADHAENGIYICSLEVNVPLTHPLGNYLIDYRISGYGHLLGIETWRWNEDSELDVPLEVTEDVPVDVGVSRIAVPPANVGLNDIVAPEVVVRNYGSVSVTCDVRFVIHDSTGATIYDTTETGLLVPVGDSTFRTFTKTWTAAPLGEYDLLSHTILTGDVDPSNDTAEATCAVIYTNDAGVCAINAPVGGISEDDEVIPEVEVVNYGAQPVTVGVRFVIRNSGGTAVYDTTETGLVVPAGDTVVNQFTATWIATPAGDYTTESHTILAGDQNPANDTAAGNFTVFPSGGNPEAGIVAILAPVGEYDTSFAVTPGVQVRNSGDVAVSFTAWFAMTDTTADAEIYRDSLPVADLEVGADSILDFTQWPGSALEGPYTTLCSLDITDNNPDNDTLHGSFTISAGSGPNWPAGWHEVTQMPKTPSGKAVKRGGWLTLNQQNYLIYGAKGYKTTDFHSYNPLTDAWTQLTGMPYEKHSNPKWARKVPRKGSKGVADGDNYVYITQGNNTLGFWRYQIDTDSWTELQDVPVGPDRKKVKGGTDLAYLVLDDTGWVYCLKGYRCEFYRYNTETGLWSAALANAPTGKRGKWGKGSWVVHAPFPGHDAVYAHKAKYNELWIYNVAADSWHSELEGMPFVGRQGRKKKSKDGGCGAWYEYNIYALKGGNTQEFWQYNVLADSWTELDTLPAYGTTGRKKRVKYGADIVSVGYDAFFALKGNKTVEFWRYRIPTAVPASYSDRNGIMAERSAIPGLRFTVAPNPTTGADAALRYALPQAGPAALTICDVAGRTVLKRTFTLGRSGTISADLSKLSAGVYLVRLRSAGFEATRKLVIR